ncbi:MAG: hypothetical protein ACRDNS_33290, partial [Trebonia sp.]
MDVQTPPAIAAAGPAPASPAVVGRRGLDAFEIALWSVFGALSLWVVALDVWHAAARGLVWTGTDGFFIVDQMQYLAWVQSAAHHLLIANLFVLRPTPSDYFQPAIALSGALTALGVAAWVALLSVFGAFSLWVVALDLWHAAARGLVWTGTDGFFIVDQMQYLGWVQSAAHHLLIANLFVLRSTPADYFQPAIALSGAITALGVAAWVALLLWKPVAVVGLFMA